MLWANFKQFWIVKFNTFGFFPPYGIKAVEFTRAVQASLVKINPPIVSMVEINLKFAIRF